MESAANKDKSSNTASPAETSESQSLSKAEAIELLNDSIDRLEATINNISQNSGKNLPSSESINTLIDTTKELADAVVVPSQEPELPKDEPNQVEAVKPVELVESVETNSTSAVTEAVKVMETTTPAASPTTPVKTPTTDNSSATPSQKQENRALTIIGIVAIAIAIVAVVWLWLLPTDTMVSSTVEPATEIVDASQPAIQPPISQTPDIAENSQPLVAENIPQNLESSSPEVAIPVDTLIPQELTSPGKTQNLKITTIEPELTFTPEQTLVADLQTKLAELVASYDQDLFDRIQIDLPQNSLLVELTDNWYRLSESRQHKLANQILNRSRQLQFSKLELQDTAGTLVARNPVVGEQIIILQSHQE